MTLEEMNLEENLEIELEDILSGIAGDLVAYKSNSLFLDRLFTQQAGKWIEIEPLCSSLNQIENQLKELRESFDGEIRVTWIDYPNYGELDCAIVFFVEDLLWSNVALYNKQLFFEKLSHTTSTSAKTP